MTDIDINLPLGILPSTSETISKSILNNPLLTGRAGGIYLPPFKLKQQVSAIQRNTEDINWQRIQWDYLRKTLNGLINKINTSNISHIVPELFTENLIAGRGIFCKSIMKAQMASPNFSHVYAALISVINTKMPEIGELLLKRLIVTFRRAYKRNIKEQAISCVQFLAHLVNQQVVHEVVALQLLTLLLENPTDDSVQMAVTFVKECGQTLTELSPKGINAIFERFRGILHEGVIDRRVQYLIEGLFAVRKSGFQDYPAIIPDLDLIEMDDQYTHELSLDEDHDIEERLNIFHKDDQWEEHQLEYDAIRKEILDEASDEESSGVEEDGQEIVNEEEAETKIPERVVIEDQTEMASAALRRTIYLTIMSSASFEECAHKLLKIKMSPGDEKILCKMVLECCMQERTYVRFYGLLGERFCQVSSIYRDAFDDMFAIQYVSIHHLETNKLRNVAKFFAHLLCSDALDWGILEYIHLNEQETTSSSRIFIKILFQEISEYMSLAGLKKRMDEPSMQEAFEGLFPKDNPKNTRFAINFFTSIGLGGLTDALRKWLKETQKRILEQRNEAIQKAQSENESESSSEFESSSDESSSDDSSGSASSDSSSSDSDIVTSQSKSLSRSISPPKSKSRHSRSPTKYKSHHTHSCSPHRSKSRRSKSRSRSSRRDSYRQRDHSNEHSRHNYSSDRDNRKKSKYN